jgi:hypothetical protein
VTRPPITVETLLAPALYAPAQLALALQIAATIDRGKLVLVEAPKP